MENPEINNSITPYLSLKNITMIDNKTVLQALALINDYNKYKIELTTNGVVITDAIKFVQTNKEKLSMSTNEENKESNEIDYDENKEQLEEEQKGNRKSRNNKSGFLNGL